jgi:hypothetical protein
MMIACTGSIRGHYLCTQCLGDVQPMGPLAELLFIVQLRDQDGALVDEEYVCTPCMDALLDGRQEFTVCWVRVQ